MSSLGGAAIQFPLIVVRSLPVFKQIQEISPFTLGPTGTCDIEHCVQQVMVVMESIE